MPTIYLFRLWCKACSDYQLHDEISAGGYRCRECGAGLTHVPLRAIPEKKIAEQRMRYNEAKKLGMKSMLQGYLPSIQGLLSTFGEKTVTKIIESDAGQKYLDNIERERLEKERQEIETSKKEAQKYRHIGRNAPCPCASGLKYKNCHLPKVAPFL